MADLTRNDVLSNLRGLLNLGVYPDRDAATYGLLTDRIAALALVLRELPAEPAPQVVEAPVVEPAPVQDPECPYPPVLTRWGWATWRLEKGDWLLYAPGCIETFYIAKRAELPSTYVYGRRNGEGDLIITKPSADPMPAILDALRELGSLPDEAPHAP